MNSNQFNQPISPSAHPHMKAMILAAGLGTRLKPFTDTHPKALYAVNGKTLLENSLLHLRSAGIKEVIINVHHFAYQIVDFLHLNNNFGMMLEISDETVELLDTGGGLKKASWFFKDCDCVIVRNVDILSDLDLNSMAASHLQTGSLATLAVRDRETSRYFLFNQDMDLCGWENRKTGERKISVESANLAPLAFSGIQIFDPAVFPLITESGKFSLTELYLRLAKDQMIKGYLETNRIWDDVGKLRSEI
jgi:NDP-sugar pyrophosphorylase family protein